MQAERTILINKSAPKNIKDIVLPVLSRYFSDRNEDFSFFDPLFRWETESRDGSSVSAALWKQDSIHRARVQIVKDGEEANFVLLVDPKSWDMGLSRSYIIGDYQNLSRWFTSTCMALHDGMTPEAIALAASVTAVDKSVADAIMEINKFGLGTKINGERIYDAYVRNLALFRFRAY